jgi:hypothetical protein
MPYVSSKILTSRDRFRFHSCGWRRGQARLVILLSFASFACLRWHPPPTRGLKKKRQAITEAIHATTVGALYWPLSGLLFDRSEKHKSSPRQLLTYSSCPQTPLRHTSYLGTCHRARWGLKLVATTSSNNCTQACVIRPITASSYVYGLT